MLNICYWKCHERMCQARSNHVSRWCSEPELPKLPVRKVVILTSAILLRISMQYWDHPDCHPQNRKPAFIAYAGFAALTGCGTTGMFVGIWKWNILPLTRLTRPPDDSFRAQRPQSIAASSLDPHVTQENRNISNLSTDEITLKYWILRDHKTNQNTKINSIKYPSFYP